MKGRSIFSLMVGFVICGAGSESVLAQTTIAVPARSFCVDSGINVSRGDFLQFSASGQGSYGYEGSPVNNTPLTNPDGDRFVNGVNIGKKDDPNAIYKGFIGGLVGKVGANGNYFFIGSNNQLSMDQSGRLFLCYNDVANSFNNNTGGYRVSINRISDPNQQNTAGRSPSPNQQANTGRSQELTRCVRWSSFSQGLTTTSGGRGGIWLAFNELPDGFKQGCIFFEDNNSLDVAYVLKDGIEPSAKLSNGLFYDYRGGVPSLGFGYRGDASHFRAQQSRQSLEDLMRRGQALMITWLTPTNGSIPYLNSIPRGRAFVRDDGMVCYSTVCMSSRAVSNQELTRILEAGQNVNTAGRSPSPNQQTNTGRSPASNPQSALNRSPAPSRELPPSTERSLLVVANPQSIRGVNVPPADKSPSQLLNGYGFILDKPNAIKLNDGTKVYSIDVYNTGYADGVVEVYDARNNLIEVRGITGIRNPATNLYGFPLEGANRLFRLLTEGYGFTDPRNAIGRSQKTEIRNIPIPPGGRMIFTKNSERAMRYNQATFAIGVLSDTVLPKVFDGDKLTFKSKLLLSVYTEIQKERVGSLVKDGMFLTLRDSQKAFTNQSWIDEQNLSYLMATGSKVLAQELAKSGVEQTVINQLVLGKKLNFWVTAAETFAQGSNIFLQWLDLDRSQKLEQQDGQPFGIANNK
jgi:hypothetical protein